MTVMPCRRVSHPWDRTRQGACWEGGKFVTLDYDASLGPDEVAKVVDLVFLSFFNRATYDVEVEMIQLD